MSEPVNRYIIAAARSGSNWLRFCVEEFYGIGTPGKTLLLSGRDALSATIIRRHDALKARRILWKSRNEIWQPVDPAETAGGRVLLMIRDPLELYVRMAHRHMGKFLAYPGNIRFLTLAAAEHKMVVYYDELISDPARMAEALAFLDLPMPADRPAPTAEHIAARWQEVSAKSRALYEKNQKNSGGAHTRSNPLDFKFHQRKLSEWRKRRVWQVLRERLDDRELALLDRYMPEGGLPVPGRFDRLADVI